MPEGFLCIFVPPPPLPEQSQPDCYQNLVAGNLLLLDKVFVNHKGLNYY